MTNILNVVLCIVFFTTFSTAKKIDGDYKKINTMRSQTVLWEQTQDLYRTNITNQLDRNNFLEESIYHSNAQRFYNNVTKHHKTFIIAPYNYATLPSSSSNSVVYVGQDRFPDKKEYIVRPGGIDITIDVNYLQRNPIIFSSPHDEEKINSNQNSLYVLIPEKYKDYESLIKTYYLEDLTFRISEDPPNQTVDIEKIIIEPIYVKNNQQYFTFNSFYSDNTNHLITDPIAVVVNPDLMNGLFWGNILTADGGFFLDIDSSSEFNSYELIKNDIVNSGLNGILNFTLSVYNEHGEYLSNTYASLFNLSIQFSIIVALLLTLKFQITVLIFSLNAKKIFLRRTLGYPQTDQIKHTVMLPIILELATLISFCVLNIETIIVLFPVTCVILLLNMIIYQMVFFKYKNITLKENFYDI